jgi:hypothetical protein
MLMCEPLSKVQETTLYSQNSSGGSICLLYRHTIQTVTKHADLMCDSARETTLNSGNITMQAPLLSRRHFFEFMAELLRSQVIRKGASQCSAAETYRASIVGASRAVTNTFKSVSWDLGT